MYPWQMREWQQLMRLKKQNRLPHAFLFIGLPGVGKAAFADQFSCALLCESVTNEGYGCGRCHSCRLIKGRTHPNVFWIEPDKDGKVIKVDQVCEVSSFIHQSALQGEYRIVVINPADQLNANAANALLKTLEEPTPGSILILINNQLSLLPATITSRCQRIVFPNPPRDQALAWLQNELPDNTIDPDLLLNLTHGAPLSALKLVEDDLLSVRYSLLDDLYLLNQNRGDPIKTAAKIQDLEPVQFIDFMLSWILDLLQLQLGNDEIINKDYQQILSQLTLSTNLKTNTQLMDYLQDLRIQMFEGINFNKQMLMESVLISWTTKHVSR